MPRAMLHEKAEHDWGVATGLEVRQTGVQQLRVSPGVAIDRAGRLIALSDADAGPSTEGGKIDTSSNDYTKLGKLAYITIRHEMTSSGARDEDLKGRREYFLEPIVGLESQKTIEQKEGAVVLAVVELEEDGKVKALCTVARRPRAGPQTRGRPRGRDPAPTVEGDERW